MNSVLRFIVITLLGVSLTTRAAQLLELLPLRNDMLLLRISDGSIAYAKTGELQTADKITSSPLTTLSLTAAAFTITSSDDTAYSSSKAATAIARKSKGVDFANNETNWTAGYGYKPTEPYAVSEHLLYLTLPTPLLDGKAYTVSWNKTSLGLESGTANLTFSSASSRSEAIHVNIVGYVPTAAAKYGYLYHWAGDGGGVDFSAWAGKPFVLVRESDGSVAFTGTVAFRKSATNIETGQTNDTPNRNYIGAAVWECDFSSFTQTGRYRLSIPGIGCSFPFSIDADAYRSAFHATMKGLYQNRSGIALVTPFADKARPAPHNVKITPGFSTRLKYTTTRFTDYVTDGGGPADKAAIEAGAKGTLSDTWGWYQDAGDWDGYFQHIAIPSTLLLLYQLHPEKFSDGELNIPESGNGIPDIVDEGAWLPRYFARLRAELKAKGWGTGGVGGRVFGDYWGEDRPNGIMRGSWQDVDRDWYVTGEDPFTSYRYAATAAQLAEILQSLGKSDPQGVNWLAEATESYAWAASHTLAGDAAKDINGTLKDHRAVAAAALFRATNDEAYHLTFKSDVASIAADSTLNETQLLAATLYLSHSQPGKLDATVRIRLTAALKQNALSTTEYSGNQRACRWGGNFWFPMLIGQGTTPMILPGVLGYKILTGPEPTAAATILSYAYTTSDYFLGTNALNTTWVTGLGPRSPRSIFHMDDWLNGTTPHTGVVPYGPTTFNTSWIPYRMNASLWWAWDTTYPTIDSRGIRQPEASAQRPGTWPGHECFFPQRGSPQATEFTIWQTILPSAVTYGFLCDQASSSIVITAQPQSQIATAGSSVSFAVTTSGSPTGYQWSFNGTNLPGANRANLTLTKVQPAQQGNYQVVITTSTGSITSDVATLTVNPLPVFTTQPLSQPAFVGATISFTTGVTSSSSLHYQWQKGGIDISNATNPNLVISNVQLTDAGSYALIATDAVGSATSHFARLVVLVPQSNAIVYATTISATSVTAGGAANLAYFITNTGTQAWGAKHYLSIRDVNNTFTAFSPLIGILPGENTTATLNFPAPTTPGTYTYYVQALEDGVQFFSTQTTITLTVLAPLTNSITYNTTTFPVSAAPGSDVIFTYNVTNTGTQTWGANHLLSLKASNGSTLSSALLTILTPGASKTVNLRFTAPTTPGIYQYSVQALQTGVGNFNTHADLTLVVLAPRPNAIVYTSIRLPEVVVPGASLNLNYSLSNAGAQSWGSGHYVSLRDGSGTFLAFIPISGIATSGKTSVAFGFTAPTVPGKYTYYVQALEDGVEFFSTQEVVVLTVVALPLGNAVTYNASTFPFTASPGATINFTTNVTNRGTRTWGATHYLSFRDIDNTFLAFPSLNGIAPGGSVTCNLSFAAPVAPGIYTYTLQAFEDGVSFFDMSDTLVLLVQ